VSIDHSISICQILGTIGLKSTPPKQQKVEKDEVANYILAWLEHRGIQNHLIEAAPGRYSAVRAVDGRGRGIYLTLPDIGSHETNMKLAAAMISISTSDAL
jgi:hypothetical protein